MSTAALRSEVATGRRMNGEEKLIGSQKAEQLSPQRHRGHRENRENKASVSSVLLTMSFFARRKEFSQNWWFPFLGCGRSPRCASVVKAFQTPNRTAPSSRSGRS